MSETPIIMCQRGVALRCYCCCVSLSASRGGTEQSKKPKKKNIRVSENASVCTTPVWRRSVVPIDQRRCSVAFLLVL